MSISHHQVVAAVKQSMALENTLTYPRPGFGSTSDRYVWLTEVELVCRLREELIAGGAVAREDVKLNAQGRLAKGATNHDIEVGAHASTAVEAVYCFARKKPIPGKTLSNDLKWLVTAPRSSHVVAFFPRMVAGFRAGGKKSSPRTLKGEPLALAAHERLLTDCLQAEGLDSAVRYLCNGVMRRLNKPPCGRKARWTLADKILPLKHDSITRSLAGSPSDTIWAVVWSRQ
jgi:hypothetical protein